MFKAKDGKEFGHPEQARLYDKSLDTKENAPGGPSHLHDLREHGPVKKITIERTGNGRHEVRAVHQDGFRSQSVHPEAFRAHEIARELLGIEPPPAIQTHSRARSQPTGPKEDERIRQEDGREEDER